MQIEGIYRVNGNQADIGLIEQKVEESELLLKKVIRTMSELHVHDQTRC